MEGVVLDVFESDCQVRTIGNSKTNLFWSDEAVHELQALQMLSWTQSHGKQVKFTVYEGFNGCGT